MWLTLRIKIMTKFEKFLNKEVNIKDIDVARNIYVASLGLFIFTAMFSSLFSIAYGNQVVNTAAVYNSKIEDKVRTQVEARSQNIEIIDASSIMNYKDENIEIKKPELSFSVSSEKVKKGDIVRINWTSKNADKCTLMDNDKVVSNAIVGDIVSDPIDDTTLIWISCSNRGGSNILSSKITVK